MCMRLSMPLHLQKRKINNKLHFFGLRTLPMNKICLAEFTEFDLCFWERLKHCDYVLHAK